MIFDSKLLTLPCERNVNIWPNDRIVGAFIHTVPDFVSIRG